MILLASQRGRGSLEALGSKIFVWSPESETFSYLAPGKNADCG